MIFSCSRVRWASVAVSFAAAFFVQSADAEDDGGAWSSQCISPSRSAEAVCTLSHRVTLQETGQTVFVFEIRTRPNAPRAEILVSGPLGLFLPDGISLAVDGTPLLDLVLERCDQAGCYARQNLASDALSEMRAGDELEVRFSPVRNTSRTIELPLAGFDEGFARIE